MELSRRDLLRLGAFQASAALWPFPATTSPGTLLHRRSHPSIVQGATDESRTQFSIVHSRHQRLQFFATSSMGLENPPDRVDFLTREDQPMAISRVSFSNLHLGENYSLILQDQESGKVVDQRSFGLLDTRKKSLRFAVCSCMDDNRHSPGIWQDLVKQGPDFIIFAGDSTYCDYGDGPQGESGPSRLWRRFAEARTTLEIYFGPKLIPIFATWDDHDFGKNDSGSEYPHVQESQQNFLRFFPMAASHCSALEKGPGVSSRLLMGNQQFLLMDDRSWRKAGQSSERYAHWGREQEEWMMNHLSSHNGMNWLVNGSQFFPQMPFKESFSGDHPENFNALLKQFKDLPGKVGFISGDVHFSEISRIERRLLGYETYELTSSSIHSSVFPGAPGIIPNDRRVVSTGQRNYLFIESVPEGPGCRMQVQSRSEKNRVNFSVDLSV